MGRYVLCLFHILDDFWLIEYKHFDGHLNFECAMPLAETNHNQIVCFQNRFWSHPFLPLMRPPLVTNEEHRTIFSFSLHLAATYHKSMLHQRDSNMNFLYTLAPQICDACSLFTWNNFWQIYKILTHQRILASFSFHIVIALGQSLHDDHVSSPRKIAIIFNFSYPLWWYIEGNVNKW